MNNKLVFYVDTNWTNEGHEYVVGKLLLQSGDTNAQTKIKGRTLSECNEKLHQQILKERPQQVIFERTGFAAPSKDSYFEYLSQHLGDVLMDQAGNLYYSNLESKQKHHNVQVKPKSIVSFSKNDNISNFKVDTDSLYDPWVILDKLGIQPESLLNISALNLAKDKISLSVSDGGEEFKNWLDEMYKLNMWVMENPPVK